MGENKANKPLPTGWDLYLRYALGGGISCSVTHSVVVPLDVVKTRIQLYPERYKGIAHGFRTIVQEEGAMMLLQGVGPTAVGYALQGVFKFGFYEFFKKKYAGIVGEDADKYRIPIWLAAGGSAEVIADLALCPMEATRIRLVSDPSFAKGLPDGFAKILQTEGLKGLYKGLPPILFKQVPYTMAKFGVFEKTSEVIYSYLPKEKMSAGQQLTVSLGGGIASGLVAAVISQPADTVLSVINKNKTDEPMIKAIFRITRELGAAKLFKGLGARCVMVGTLTAGQFFIYDGLKVAFGLPTTGSAKK